MVGAETVRAPEASAALLRQEQVTLLTGPERVPGMAAAVPGRGCGRLR